MNHRESVKIIRVFEFYSRIIHVPLYDTPCYCFLFIIIFFSPHSLSISYYLDRCNGESFRLIV